jgi:cyclopropane fatty-acyl-phospholipid synthase-like methyltransferase
MGKKEGKKKGLTLEQKYEFYEASVQNAEGEVLTIQEKYKELRHKEPRVLREDFCGTGTLMCEWVKLHRDNFAYGVDLDSEPIAIGKDRHWSKLKESEQKRVKYLEGNVLDTKTEKADIIVAFNFSYFVFRARQDMVNYFKNVRKNMEKDAVFFLDIFGGPDSQTLMEEETEYNKFSYFWDCVEFNPITHECKFAIHFKPKKEKKIKNVFSYSWRFWTLPEIRDILIDAGFKKTVVFWEGDDEDGEGNGEFTQTEQVENCLSWVSYIAALN